MGYDLNDLAAENDHAVSAQAVYDHARLWKPPASIASGPGAPNAPPELPYFRGLDGASDYRDMVVKGLFGSGEISALYGAPKTGKSFLVTDLALAVAGGDPTWMGHKVKRHGQVLYLVMEGAGGFANRLQAYRTHRCKDVPGNFVRIPHTLSFLGEGTAASAMSDIARIKRLVTALEGEEGVPVALIVVDTAARAMAGGDENSAQDMGAFLNACAELQNLPSAPHVLVVHHANAGGQKARGSTALPAGVDTLIRVERTGQASKWKVEFAKDDPETDWRGFSLQSIDLGKDEDGDPITSCVVVEADVMSATTSRKAVTPTGTNQKLVWRALQEMSKETGRKRRAQMLTGVPYAAVWCEDVKKHCQQLAGWDAPTSRKRFPEALNGLIGNGFVDVDEARKWVWPQGASD